MDDSDEEEADGKLRGDLEFTKDQLFQEFETFMTLKKSMDILKLGDLDILMREFADFLAWAHRPPQDFDDGR